MKVSIQSNIAEARRELQRQAQAVKRAMPGAINDAAFEARKAIVGEMRRVFDRPTPFILGSVWVNTATDAKPIAAIYPRDPGGKSVDPDKVLLAEVFGGRRRAKRAERALQRVGVLPQGFGMVPAKAAPLDAYGNVPGPFIVQLLSYLQAFGEVGYRANMTARRKAQLSRRGRWVDGRFVPQSQAQRLGLGRAGAKAQGQGGVEYFVSRGRGTWGAMPAAGREGRQQHLPAGIWVRRGVHGEDVQPVFLFVRLPSYRNRLDFHAVAERVVAEALPRRIDARIRQAEVRRAARAWA